MTLAKILIALIVATVVAYRYDYLPTSVSRIIAQDIRNAKTLASGIQDVLLQRTPYQECVWKMEKDCEKVIKK